MQGTRFTHTVHITGTLSANASGEFALPCPASLVHVSAVASNASSATLDVGTGADPNGIIAAGDVGDSATPATWAPANFNGALVDGVSPYHMAAGAIVAWDLDYDGSSGTAAQNFTLVLTFTEG